MYILTYFNITTKYLLKVKLVSAGYFKMSVFKGA